MTLNDYARALGRSWRGILVIMVVGLGLSWAITEVQPRVYQSTATGMVTSPIVADSAGDLLSLNEAAQSRATSYAGLATSVTTASMVKSTLGLPDDPESLVNAIKITQPEDTVLIQIDARADTADKAQLLANTWLNELTKQVRQIEDPTNAGRSLALTPVDPATTPSAPILPSRRDNLLVGGIASMLVALTYSLWRAAGPGAWPKRVRD